MVVHLNFSYVQHYGTMMIRSIGIYLRLTNGCASVFVRGQGLANGANNISLYDFIKVIFIGEDEFLIFHPFYVTNSNCPIFLKAPWTINFYNIFALIPPSVRLVLHWSHEICPLLPPSVRRHLNQIRSHSTLLPFLPCKP